jgi:hypothetical protein
MLASVFGVSNVPSYTASSTCRHRLASSKSFHRKANSSPRRAPLNSKPDHGARFPPRQVLEERDRLFDSERPLRVDSLQAWHFHSVRWIHLAFRIPINKDVVRRILAARYHPKPDAAGPSWLTVLGHAKDSLWSLDLCMANSKMLTKLAIRHAQATDPERPAS